jgi:hypothetical protein
VDGNLIEASSPPKALQLPIASRIKILAGLDIAERRLPQDGRFRIRALVPGVYTIEVKDGEAVGSVVQVAVNQANTAASNLASRFDEATVPEASRAGEAPDSAPRSEGPLWTLIMLAAVALIAVEWATYHRRQTV